MNDSSTPAKVGSSEGLGVFDAEMAAMVKAWQRIPQEKGRPTCPCGFSSGSSNIRKHRLACKVWLWLTWQQL